MRVLITGGAGFIGSWLIDELSNYVEKITIIDNFSPQIHGQFSELDQSWEMRKKKVTCIRADIRDNQALDEGLSASDVVIHLAAETGTGQSMYNISHYSDVNQQATSNLFDRVVNRHKHIKRIILASSRSVYGEGAYELNGKVVVPKSRDVHRLTQGLFEPVGPSGESLKLIATSEETLANPASVYAATKLSNEVQGRIISEAYGLTIVALRFQNVYGERQSLKNPYTGILSIFSNRMRQNLPINIFEDGMESRDFIHVSDVVRAIRLSLSSVIPSFSIANIGSGSPVTVLSLAHLLKDYLKSSSDLKITGDFRVGDIRHCYAETTKALNLHGFKTEISLDQGIEAFCNWVLTQPIIEDTSQKAQERLSNAGLGRASNLCS